MVPAWESESKHGRWGQIQSPRCDAVSGLCHVIARSARRDKAISVVLGVRLLRFTLFRSQ